MHPMNILLLCLLAFVLGLVASPRPAYGANFDPLTRDEPIVRMVLQEAIHEPFAGLVAVAGVAFDRMEDRRWPSTDRKVVYQRAQFTGMGIRLRRYSQEQITRARRAVAGASFGFRPCGTVLWYHTHKVKPSWRKRYQLVCRLGTHLFYGDVK